MKTTTKQLIAHARDAADQIDRVSTSAEERRELRLRLANAVRRGRLIIELTRQREQLLSVLPR